MSGSKMLVLDPSGERKDLGFRLAPRPADLKGATVGLVDNGHWWSFGVVLQRYTELLKEHYGVENVIYMNWKQTGMDKKQAGQTHEDVIEDLAAKCQVVFTGLGN
ncbi:MAG: hypothetical protein Q7O66_02125 [Dehalococcoidia bacterium]|nr:hypothetical protein [Dehalococcoidia bacterium]